MDVYIKGEHCEDSLKDLHFHLRRDNPERPFVKTKLGEWNFLEKDLIPLMLTQKRDKKLSFLIAILLVDLTEPPHSSC